MEVVAAVWKGAQQERIVRGVPMALAAAVLLVIRLFSTYDMLFTVRADPLPRIQNGLVNAGVSGIQKRYQPR